MSNKKPQQGLREVMYKLHGVLSYNTTPLLCQIYLAKSSIGNCCRIN